MAPTKTTPLARTLHRVVHGTRLRHQNDRELLERYTAHRDEAAFAELVRRHGPRVLAACRAVLADQADAEDAFQATFLVLLDKAGKVRWQEDVGGWLYAVAHRVAIRARTRARNRRRHEANAPAPTADCEADLSWREACALLHSELDRLPDKFRLPLLLCYLEGKSRDEAAAQLGLTTATVKSRLERGRNALRTGLRRCGVTLTAGLLAVVANSPAGAVPARLVQATLSAAAGQAPAAVAALVQGVTAIMILGKFKCVAGLLLVAGLLGTLFVLNPLAPVVAEPAPREAKASEPPTRKRPDAKSEPDAAPPMLTFSGRVVDPDGAPVAGATLTVVPSTGKEDGFEPVAAPGLTEADGRFRFTVPTAKTLHRKAGVPVPALVATAPGFFPGWSGAREGQTIRLAREDAKVTGRVVTLEGNPVAGATVRVKDVSAPAAGTLDPWLTAAKAPRNQGAHDLEQEHLPGEMPAELLPGVTVTARTDAQGRFELRGYGKDRLLKAVVAAPSITAREVRFVTRDVATFRVPTFPPATDVPGSTTYYGTSATHVADPTRPISGVVRDRATKQPLAGVTLQSYTMAGSPMVGEQFWAKATTDAAGRFTLVGMPKGAGNSVLVTPTNAQPYVVVRVDVPDPPGFTPVALDIELVRGVWIEGAVTDQETGRPVARAEVEYHAHATDNRTIRETPGLEQLDRDERWDRLTGSDGTFRVLGLPGKGYLLIGVNDTRYVSAAERDGDGAAGPDSLPTLPYSVSAAGRKAVHVIDVPKETATYRQSVTVAAGMSFTAALLGPDGQPVAGARSFRQRGWGGWNDETKPGQHRIEAYNPKKPRPILFCHVEKNLVGELKVPADFMGDSCTVALKPGVVMTGRVVDGNGNPKAGVEVELSFRRNRSEPSNSFTPRKQKQSTDADGRFRFAGLAPGFTYSPVLDGVHYAGFDLRPDATGTRDVGDIRLVPREK